MAFTARVTGNQVRAADITEIQDALTGTSGGGQALKFTALSDASNYALVLKNAHTTTGQTLHCTDENDYTLLQVLHHTVTVGHASTNVKVVHTAGSHTVAATMHAMTATWDLAAGVFNAISVTVTDTNSDDSSDLLKLMAGASGTTDVFHVSVVGKVFVNDSANTKMNQGITINQGANDNEILAFKSSDVGHAMTTNYEADTYGCFKKNTAASGGLLIEGLTEVTIGACLAGYATTANATRSTSGTANVQLTAALDDGANGLTTIGANQNILAITDNNTTRFIFDSDGDIHCDAGGSYGGAVISGSTILGYNTYDEFEDAELVRALEVERSGRGLVRQEFDRFLRYNRQDLERLKIATFNPDSTFVNYTALVRLHSGAIWQLHRKLQDTLDRLAATEQQLRLALSNNPSLEAAR